MFRWKIKAFVSYPPAWAPMAVTVARELETDDEYRLGTSAAIQT
jgi:hypothetical protein